MKRFVSGLVSGLVPVLVSGLAAAALSFAGVKPAGAAILDYQLTGALTASWQIDTSRTPDDIRPDMFGYWNVPITVDGVHYASSVIYFFPDSSFGGVEADQGLDPNGAGQNTFFSAAAQWTGQLYSGSTADPTLLTGSWDLTEFQTVDLGDPVWPIDYHLTVTFDAVPEPAAWLLTMIGVALTGLALRRRRSREHGALSAA